MIFESDVLEVEEAQMIKDALMLCLKNEEPTVKLDLRNINKIDLSVIQLFLSLQKSLHNQNRNMTLINCTNSVIEALELCGCSKLFECTYE
ncbi:MAG: STAS domain-containing protein [Campylobacterales bacterium]|nr:STAS domain-containing protein [Campylobacterales bacterium]